VAHCCLLDPPVLEYVKFVRSFHMVSAMRTIVWPPAFAVRDSEGNSLTLARIGPNGLNLCCSAGKRSAFVEIGFIIDVLEVREAS
jgi:hypothetical protein